MLKFDLSMLKINALTLKLNYFNISGKLDFGRFKQLKELYLSHNEISSLDCSYNQIISIDNLSPLLNKLNCSYNQILLDNLPNQTEKIYCEYYLI